MAANDLSYRLLEEDGQMPAEGPHGLDLDAPVARRPFFTRRVVLGGAVFAVVAVVVLAAVLGSRAASSSSSSSSSAGASTSSGMEAVPPLFSPSFSTLHQHDLVPTPGQPRNFVYHKQVKGIAGGFSVMSYNVTFQPGVISIRKFPSILSMKCSQSVQTVTLNVNSSDWVNNILNDTPKLLVVNLTHVTCNTYSRYNHIIASSMAGNQITFTTVPANFSELFEDASIILNHRADRPSTQKRDAQLSTPLNFNLAQTFNIFSADGFTLSCDNCGVTTDLTLNFAYSYSILDMTCSVNTNLQGTITPAITLDFQFSGSYSNTWSGPVPGVSDILSSVNAELEVGFADIGLSPSFGLNYNIAVSANAQLNAVAGVSIPVAVDFGLSGSCGSPSITSSANPTVNLIGPSATGTASASATFTLSPSVGVTAVGILSVTGQVSPYVTATATGNGQMSVANGQFTGSGSACLGLSGGVNGEVDAGINLGVWSKTWSDPFTIYAQQSLWNQCYSGSY